MTEMKSDGLRIDKWLIRTGIGLATCSVAFAGAMITFRGPPKINGIEHLAIFAQPNRSIRIADSGAKSRIASSDPRAQVDPTPTGSIAPQAVAIDPDDHEIIAVSADTAWVRSKDTILAIKVGQNLSGLGRVASIVRRNGSWLLVDAEGSTVLADSRPAQDAIVRRPDKRLIFNGAE